MKRILFLALAIGFAFSTFLHTITSITDPDGAWLDLQMPGIGAAYLFWGSTGGSASIGIFVGWLVNAMVYGGGVFAILGVIAVLKDSIRPAALTLSRSEFWRLNCLCALSVLAAYLLIDVRVHPNWVTSSKTAIGYLAFLVTCAALITIGVRRLHERGRSYLWAGLYYPSLLLVTTADYSGHGGAILAIAWTVVVCALIDLGILRSRRPTETAT